MTSDKTTMRRFAYIFVLTLLLGSVPAWAVKIADITRLSGQRTNVISGMGLVFGLKGTGDGGDYAGAMQPLRELMARFANPLTLPQLNNTQNVAIVQVTAVLPANGVRDGDRIDVHLSTIGVCKNLKGGRLFVTPLLISAPGGEKLPPIALAEGPITIQDPSMPTAGVIKGGAVMETDLPAQVIDNGKITLILEEPAASWTTASRIAKRIKEAEEEAEAVAIDSKNIVVTIPKSELHRPDSFISRVQQLPVPLLPTEARVQINEKTGTIIMTGDVEISPVVISHKGLTITTINPPPTPSPRTPVTTEHNAMSLDTTAQGGPKLQELVDALDSIRVPAEDRIAIVKELYKTGKLHAKLIVE